MFTHVHTYIYIYIYVFNEWVFDTKYQLLVFMIFNFRN